jgi:hypothetical protein
MPQPIGNNQHADWLAMDKPQSLDKGLIAWGLLTTGLGLYPLLIGTGMVDVEPKSVHGPLWIATCAGFIFALAGISLVIRGMTGVADSDGELPKTAPWWLRFGYYLAGLAAVAALAAIGSWVAFGGGPRAFNMTVPFFATRDTGETIGRTVFGAGALMTWLFLIAFAISGARKLFGQPKLP